MANHAKHLYRSSLLVALLIAAPATAWADEVDHAPNGPRRPLYGLAMAGGYAVAPILGLVLSVTVSPLVGIPVFLTTPPAVHIAYDDPLWAVASFLGTLSLPLVGAGLAISLSQCQLIGIFGKANCDGPALAGAVFGYALWSAIDITVSSLRGTSRLHDNFKRSPQPVHEPSTPDAPPAASVGACLLDRSRG